MPDSSIFISHSNVVLTEVKKNLISNVFNVEEAEVGPSWHQTLSQNLLVRSTSSIHNMAQTTIAVPGQLLGSMTDYLPGPGIHIHNTNLYASILGPISKTQPPKPVGPQKRLTKITPAAPVALPTISIERNISASNSQEGGSKAEILPEVNSTVLCRVTRIAPRQATVAILVVGDTVLDGEWQGLIRVQDVRATEKDKVKIFESFRPGDIVRAVVVSILSRIYGAGINWNRFHWAISQITTFRLRLTTSV
jgi:exosome complex component CSL4